LESTQKKMVLRRHAEYILHPGGVDCGMFRQTGGPGGADSGAYVHARATVGPSGSAQGGILNLFKDDVGFTFTLVLAALQHFCISPSFERPGVRAGLQGRHSDGALGDAPRRARPSAQLVEKMC
jgi:hypothetical protein